MSTVFNRGTKDKPNWYVGYRENGEWKYHPSHPKVPDHREATYTSENGEWKYHPSHQPTKALAKRFVQEIEGRIARGQVGIEEPVSARYAGR